MQAPLSPAKDTFVVDWGSQDTELWSPSQPPNYSEPGLHVIEATQTELEEAVAKMNGLSTGKSQGTRQRSPAGGSANPTPRSVRRTSAEQTIAGADAGGYGVKAPMDMTARVLTYHGCEADE